MPCLNRTLFGSHNNLRAEQGLPCREECSGETPTWPPTARTITTSVGKGWTIIGYVRVAYASLEKAPPTMGNSPWAKCDVKHSKTTKKENIEGPLRSKTGKGLGKSSERSPNPSPDCHPLHVCLPYWLLKMHSAIPQSAISETATIGTRCNDKGFLNNLLRMGQASGVGLPPNREVALFPFQPTSNITSETSK